MNRSLGALLLLVSSMLGLAGSAQSQSSSGDPIQALKDSLSGDQGSSLLQSFLGSKGDAGKKTDSKLETPDTTKKSDRAETKPKFQVTPDGRILRQRGEDPELRADDTVLIDLTSIDEVCKRNGTGTGDNENNNSISTGAGAGTAAAATGNTADALSKLSALTGGGGLGALDALNGNNNANGANSSNSFDLSRCPPPKSLERPKTDEAKARSEDFRKRILSSNPYKLNRFGVLELPGLPAIPVAGLTASEATKRLGADPDLSDYFVALTLLRIQPTGAEGLKPFGYDLFEGSPSTFAPVTDIQVPVDYIVGPGDTLEIQLFGSETPRYELTVQRDGRINFPKLGPMIVGGLTFDATRELIEQRVAKQLIGTRVGVTMGDLRSIRVFVLGEAEKPGSYTVSGLSTMTNALFVSGGVKKIGSLRNIQLKRNGQLVTTLDLYDLLLHGDTSGDKQLKPGDVIFIPPLGNTVSVYGAVQRPAIYELKGEKTAGQAIDIAGGLLPDADAKLGQLERILPSQLHETRNIDLTIAGSRATPLANGDKLDIPSIRPTLENSVELTGYVYRPGQFQYHAGMRLTDVLGSFNELRPNADPHYIMIRRIVPPEDRVEVISADLQARTGRTGLRRRPGTSPAGQAIRVQSVGEPRTHPGAPHPGSRTAGEPRRSRTAGHDRWPGQGAGQVSARADHARQRSDSRRRQPGGRGVSGQGGIDPLCGGRRRCAQDRVDIGGPGCDLARRRRRGFAAAALRCTGHQADSAVDAARHHPGEGGGQIPRRVSDP